MKQIDQQKEKVSKSDAFLNTKNNLFSGFLKRILLLPNGKKNSGLQENEAS